MDIILLQKVANLGQIGDRVKVKSGYARNFLVPTGRATVATAANIAQFEAQRHILEAKAGQDLAAAQARALKFENFKLELRAKAGTEGKLFGSIGTADIAEALTRAGFAIERAEVRMPNGPIRNVGEQVLGVHFHTDVDVDATVADLAREDSVQTAERLRGIADTGLHRPGRRRGDDPALRDDRAVPVRAEIGDEAAVTRRLDRSSTREK